MTRNPGTEVVRGSEVLVNRSRLLLLGNPASVCIDTPLEHLQLCLSYHPSWNID